MSILLLIFNKIYVKLIKEENKVGKAIITTTIDRETKEKIEEIAKELNVSKSWLIQQAVEQYIERYDEYLSDMRIASLKEGKKHKDILKEYGL